MKSASDSDNPGQDGYESDVEEVNDVQEYELGPGKRRALGDIPNGATRQAKQPRTEELESTSFRKLHDHQVMPAVDRELADSWVVLLQGLVKGKVKMDREVCSELKIRLSFTYLYNPQQMASLSDVLNKVDRMKALISLGTALVRLLELPKLA